MFRRILSLLAALLFLLPLSVAGADGEASYWDETIQAMRYDQPHYGVVICNQMNVRNRASTSGSAYGKIRNGQPVKILGITSDGKFYGIFIDPRKTRGGMNSAGLRCGSVETCRNGDTMNTGAPEADGNGCCVRQSRIVYGKGITTAHQEDL